MKHDYGGGFVPHRFYEILIDAVQGVAGAYIELGVWTGNTFKLIYKKAVLRNAEVIGVDSFCGLPEPSTPGEENMFKGKFDVGGSAKFKADFPKAVCVEGWIPDCLESISDRKIAFAHIDVDHYKTTKQCLEYVWPRLSPGGIMVGHDFSWDANRAAMKAYRDWMSESGVDYIGVEHTSIYFRNETRLKI